ncbi:hypothetical protein N7532_000289 [Penicillium argentinense]|uniref:FAD-binding domain-containing protein n=1 Tax=Penicillium argentinense TaxID=1131581 RepID=A0A9W9KMH4_9EURO|nr:uncharacterized protein N7532_000289 [Penicillium argentinense]KAJ5112244.1 hypothetical protein N7532_000289 [Penicillium argentinense]
MSPKGGNVKVLIAGGSIAGLSLALMLEQNGIDFLVLEAYPSIAPQVGASIGVLPNGLRILNQLGCYEDVIAAAEYPVEKVVFRDSRGERFWSFDNFGEQITERHTYPVVFLDRRMLIQILYDNIQQKDKILTSERVVSVTNNPDEAIVTTKSGKTYTGTFLVGADGIHSAVRQQMWENAQKVDPTWIDASEEDALPATYACIFGISRGVSGIEKGTLTSVFNEHFSYLVPSGPGDRTYWFLVRNMGKALHGSEIPRFTKDEEESLAREHWDDCITPNLRFSELYKNKISSVYTALPEYVYKRWYFQRVMTIGDAAHKFEPLTGQGGNNAIETAAALTNHLVAALDASSSKELSAAEITSIFEKTQHQREDRTRSLVKASHARQRLECMETPLLKFIANFIVPYVPKSMLTDRWVDTYSAAVSLNMLPIPVKKRTIPYYDELLRFPSSRSRFSSIVYILLAALSFLAYQLLFEAGRENGTFSQVREAVINSSIGESGLNLKPSYTGFLPIDRILKTLVAIFLPAVTSSNPEQPLQLIYFLSSMLPLIAVFTVEGYRRKNRWTAIASPSIWGILYQLRGIGCIAPIYFAFSMFTSRKSTFLLLPGREVSAARFILPALIVGYIVPTVLLFFPFNNPETRQGIIAFWQPAPVLVSCFTYVFAGIEEATKKASGCKKSTSENSISHLRTIYQTTGVIAACVHLSVVTGCLISGDLSLTRLFIPRDSFGQVGRLVDGVLIFFQNDFLLVTVASFLWSLVNISDLYRSGLSNVNWRTGVCALFAGFVFIGPGATVAALWFLREEAIGLRHWHSNRQ